MYRFCYFCCFFLFAFASFSQEPDYPYRKYIAKQKWDKAKDKIQKELADSSDVETNYSAFRLYSSTDIPGYNLESAYQSLSNSLSLFVSIPNLEKSKTKLIKKGYTELLYHSLLDSLSALGLQSAIRTSSIDGYEHFLYFYTNAPISQILVAKNNRNALAYSSAKELNTSSAYKTFITTYPDALEVDSAWQCIYKIEYNVALQENSQSAYRSYASIYPNSPFVEQAVAKADSILYAEDFKQTLALNNEDDFRLYAAKYPKSPFTPTSIALAEALYASTVDPNDLESYFIYILGHHDAPAQQKRAKMDVWQIAKEQQNIRALEYCKENLEAPYPDSALLILHDIYMNAPSEDFGSLYTKFYDKYDDESLSELKTKDSLAVVAFAPFSSEGSVDENSPDYDPEAAIVDSSDYVPSEDATPDVDFYGYKNFISAAAPYHLAYEKLVELISYQIVHKLWNAALNIAQLFESDFGEDPSYLNLLNTLKADDADVETKPFPKAINSVGDEYCSVISANEKKMFFCGRDRKGSVGGEDIFTSNLTANGWTSAHSVSELNTSFNNEAPVSLSADGTTMILFVGGKLKISHKTTKGWGRPTSLPENINICDWQADAMISSDGKALIFAARKVTEHELEDLYDENSEQESGCNIFVSLLDEDGNWGAPIDLGPTINSPYGNRSPFLHPDMKTLYFSSKGHGSLGGFDVFKSTRLSDSDWTHWSTPVNLGKEINTVGYETWYTVSTNGKTAYFSKTTENLQQDLYYLNLPRSMRPNSVATISGQLKDCEQNPLDAEILWEDLQTGKMMGKAKTDPADGSYFIVLPLGKMYGYYVEDSTYYPAANHLDLRKQERSVAVNNDVNLTSFKQMEEKAVPVPMNNLFFDIDSDELLPFSYPELKRVAHIINTNHLKIQISGHADDTGEETHNQDLSLRRAMSVKNYLQSIGCDAARMSTVGYGSSKPVADNKTVEGRTLNRRVELRFVK